MNNSNDCNNITINYFDDYDNNMTINYSDDYNDNITMNYSDNYNNNPFWRHQL